MFDNFELYITQTNRQDFFVNIMTDDNFSNYIIDNKLYWKHFEFLMTVYGRQNCFQIFKLLCIKDNNKKFLSDDMYIMFEYDNFDKDIFKYLFIFLESNKIINETDLNNLLEYIINNKVKYINYEFVEYLLNSKYKNIVINNFETILDNCYYLLDLKEIIKDKTLLERYNNYINKKPDNVIYEILIKGFNLDLKEIKNEKIYDTIKQIIDELLNYEKLNYSDINFIGYGAYSFVVSIGSKVLKLGQKIELFNNRRFLKPILRTEINKINSEEVLGCVEITEKASTKNITKNDIYVVYKELRDKGYIWADCRKDNVGRLLKDNKIYFNDLNPTLSAINYNTNNEEELSHGELVIIDNDYIYSNEEFSSLPTRIQDNYLDNIEEYEIKYQEEQRRKK